MASSSAETPEQKVPAPSSASSTTAKDEDDESLIDDVTEEHLRQGITGMAVIGYRQAPARQS